jgi:hypothetical protein
MDNILPHIPRRAGDCNEKKRFRVSLAVVLGKGHNGCDHGQAQRMHSLNPKMRIILDDSNRNLSEIKLKRTDTTLDLSQKAVTRFG